MRFKLLLPFLVLALASCMSGGNYGGSSSNQTSVASGLPEDSGSQSTEYRLGTGDRLRVIVYEEESYLANLSLMVAGMSLFRS